MQLGNLCQVLLAVQRPRTKFLGVPQGSVNSNEVCNFWWCIYYL